MNYGVGDDPGEVLFHRVASLVADQTVRFTFGALPLSPEQRCVCMYSTTASDDMNAYIVPTGLNSLD